jgi:hypothetical protein
MRSGGPAFGDDEGDVVVLLVRTELADIIDDGGAQSFGRKLTVPAKGIDEALFAKFLSSGIEGFRDSVGVENKSVAGRKLALSQGAIPIFEGAHNGCSGGEAFERIIGTQEERRKVTTVGIAEAARDVVIFGEEESGEGGVGGIVAKKLVDGA